MVEAIPSSTIGTHDDPISPAVVVDEVSLTYTVRSASGKNKGPGFRSLLRASAGVVTNRVHALQPLSFIAEHGESIGVIGTNGSGKSTLMKVITGQLPPTSGGVYASSVPIMLGVNAALVPSISGDENITLGCLAMGMTRAQAEAKRASIVEISGLEESLHLPLKAYSSGMAARLQFAIATSVDPEILVIDEALNTGDAQFRERTGKRIKELREQAGCVFLVSHSLSTIQQMCSRVLWIEQGELLMDGKPEEVTEIYQQYANMLGRNRIKGPRIIRDHSRSSLMRQRVVWADEPDDRG